jgi:peroxiredoxin
VTTASAQTLEEAFRHCRDMDVSLAERLENFARAVRALAPTYNDAVDRLVRRLQENGAGENVPRPGDLMPPFLLTDDAGHLVSLESLVEAGPAAIAFHRGHWCPYCRINLDALARTHATIAAEGMQIVAIVPERQQFAAVLKQDSKAPFPILTDLDNAYAMSLNLAMWMGDELEQYLRGRAGRNIAEYQGNASWFLPIPATFVVGTDGRIKARFVDPDYRKPMAIDEMVAALRCAR